MRLQLNINNLLDYNDPYYTGIRTLAGRNYRDGFYYLEPRKFVFTTSLDF